MKLALGTVQFGCDYGISNQHGQTGLGQIKEILAYAAENDIDLLDTAFCYGESEKAIGNSCKADGFKIVTKTIVFDNKGSISVEDAEKLKEEFLRSLEKMKVQSVYALMIHHVNDLLKRGGEKLFEAMEYLKQQEFILKIGVSVYEEIEIRKVLKKFSIDIIQLPMNIFDHRFKNNGLLKELKLSNVEIHVRSAFLQGLVFMDPLNLPEHFDSVKPLLEKFKSTLQKEGLSAVEASLGFLKQFTEIDRVVCGVNNVDQLKEICQAMKCNYNSVFNDFRIDQETILNPGSWRL